MLTDDFFGVLRDLNDEHKKLKILEVYRYFYRFSMDKMQRFIDNAQFALFFYFYLKSTKCLRFHEREVLNKNLRNYYKAMENMVNESRFKTLLISCKE